ncbi:MAG: adenine deaminase, partial [Caldilineaceae bacterium]|nr:adenine deaminase [Caldilineaceae bacterium]
GMDPMRALRSVTLNPARRMRLWDRGLIAPGRAADIVLVDDLADFHAHTVLVDGKIVAQDGRCLWSAPARDGMHDLTGTVPLPQQTAADFTIRAPVDNGRVPIHLIDCVPGQTLVRKSVVDIDIADGALQLADDMAFICVVNRYADAGERAFGVIRGLGIRQGAYATTYAHDGHNLCVVGRTPADMARAANAVIAADGGIAVVVDEAQTVIMPLPIAGILSEKPVHAAADQTRALGHALRTIGIDHPYWLMRISTFTLPVSSGLRITDVGLVDAKAREVAPLFL